MRSPRNAMLPVMNAEKTLPKARKLIASIAPDETLNALSSRSRILASALRNCGVRNRLIEVPEQRHGFGLRAQNRDLVPEILAFLTETWKDT